MFDARKWVIIKEVGSEKALIESQKIINNIQGNGWGYNIYGPLENEQYKWNNRYNDTLEIVKNILRINTIKAYVKYKIFFVAYFKAVPIGILQFTPASHTSYGLPKIDFLATHCGIRNCAALLIEYAMNKSFELGSDGKLILSSLQGARQAYVNLGFISHGDTHLLILDPNNSDKWHFINGCYKYRGD
ncbi:hypothetical protein [Xenorhabdus beddingii]|uniref:hypothetical protein n=1 Tax=Xenorhabdus beddingii TaxID=40578 RepID=UPI00142895D9